MIGKVAMIIPVSRASLNCLLLFLVEATTIALSFNVGICEVFIEDPHMHDVLADGHLNGLLQATHHVRCLLLCSITSETVSLWSSTQSLKDTHT